MRDRPVAETSYLSDTQNSQETDIHASYGIQTRIPGKRSDADHRIRPLGHWDRQAPVLCQILSVFSRASVTGAHGTNKLHAAICHFELQVTVIYI